MTDAEQPDGAEALFEPKQGREEINDAIKLEEARRAALVKNLYRLGSLRLKLRPVPAGRYPRRAQPNGALTRCS